MSKNLQIFAKASVSALLIFGTLSCSNDDSYQNIDQNDTEESELELAEVITATFGTTIDFDALANYQNQNVPDYIQRDNTGVNTISDAKATLGRILFYDTKLSTNQTISCASCHQQTAAFGDVNAVSQGVNGTTGRHSMRLVNARFSDEVRFFWDERANSLEQQTTQPIQDHAEMGFSGENGAPDLNDLLQRLNTTDYYQAISQHIYGDQILTEARLQESLAQFIRSIQSFDSKYDTGRASTNNPFQNFPNYTDSENRGKLLFMNPRDQGGIGCAGCHRPDDFSIDPNSLNNGVIGVIGNPDLLDLTNTKAPSLRDLVGPNGMSNGAFMHDASLSTIRDVILHYNSIDATDNPQLDNRLSGTPGQNGQQLNLSTQQVDDLVAFLETLTGVSIYEDAKWSDPF